MSNQEIQDAIADAICYPSYEITAYQIKDSYNKGYRIYKGKLNLIKVNL